MATNSSYDSLSRLSDFRRGTLSDANSDGILDWSSSSRTQVWTLDALGNWSTLTTDGTAVSRTHDAENEVTAVNGVSLGYDNNGNTTTDAAGHRY